MSDKALQIAEKRREAKSKGERERYIYLNAEFQRIARRDKKAFLSDQSKQIAENNRMGKTRDLKKIRDTATGLEKVSFHSNPKERQCQRMLKLLHNCTHLAC